jgi:NADH:ubiquinone oxidoreductase subunit 3 (subunit A)
MGAASLILLIICGVAFAGGALLLSRAINPGSKNAQKGEAYECGVETQGTTWNQMNVGYYLFALMFLIFDVELVFLYPWAVQVKDMVEKKTGMLALMEIVVFLFILFLGFLYAHKKGALKWQ